ncbi:hypothetical protein QAD02_015427 [Eretmocerus hayati]|uniref:Uncharacterized protein n=1 Tax=Eretmocerus hayati TaxID=131215 RepID=A0ACC2P892_9HYME|nr:hypothetical protein QAD02_015427 [Eretmocerus hayati]
MSFFGVNVTNPFTSAVGQRIEQATEASLPSENWALNMEICDIINETEEGPRDAIKAIKRRLNQAAGKNYTTVMYTLTVLETCVKNCGKRFHALACSKEFISELVKLIGPKNEPPTAVQEKVLSLIQTWADTFRNQPHTQGVVQAYQELRSKGIEFPMTDLDAMAPIITPERSVPELEASGEAAAAAVASGGASSVPGASQQQQAAAYGASSACRSGGLIQLNESQQLKLRGELDIMHGNMRVLSEMIAAHSAGLNDKGNERALTEDMELMAEVYNRCKEMQERVCDLIGTLAHDELTAELLQVNDEMNNLSLRYARFTKNSSKQLPASALVAQAIAGAAAAQQQQVPLTAAQKKKLEAGDSLIDLSDDEAEAAGAAALPLPVDLLEKRMADFGMSGDESIPRRKDGEKDEFDAFAQSRTGNMDIMKNRQESRGKNEEIESSLSRPKNSMQTDKTLTSSEFELFLAERTAAAALEVSGGSASGVSSNITGASSASGSTIQRQIDKDEDKSLFAL